MKNAKKGSVATLPKHATNREERKLLEKKAREMVLAEHLKIRKAVDRLLSNNRRNVKTVAGYKEKAMSSSGTGARITLSIPSAKKGVETKIWTERDVLNMYMFVHNYYSNSRVKNNA